MKLGTAASAAVVSLWALTHAYSQPSGDVVSASLPDDDAGRFAAVILATTEDAWSRIFGELGESYAEPTLVLYTSATSTACGMATASGGGRGNFYCPSDQKIYFDPDSVREYAAASDPLSDYLTAWLIARGVSEHVQNLLGNMDPKADKRTASLRADCLVGVWSKSPESPLTADDFTALSKALERVAVNEPHAKALAKTAERLHWLEVGHASGRLEDCRVE